ncbi:sensor histidine kinase [Dysgonomonas macrotermitis]|uniref:histidine kinase n=1 Tax=Dysgonomonas macrotermitis TaxID=1346286 RepID=A0A1M5BR37_9BACT|nr:HAMP domain-containing sensor histidine kinase [Dysgonomonas macrotermitis]SHF44732.1 Signal transduction histidine kinase [Dysgonomonas macrotermitis]
MKIKTKIALRYSIVTAILMTVFAAIIYFVSAHDRETEFYDDLYKEGVSKANLYFEAKASPEIMHSIYKNNIEYIDEVEIAIYDTKFNLMYHDAKDIDIVKETPELINYIIQSKKNINFYLKQHQVVGFIFHHNNSQYVITAVAYDGYGYAKLHRLTINLIILTFICIILSFALGYFLARRALKPVSEISDRMKDITANNLHLRLLNYNEHDEFGELATSFNKALDIIESSFESQKMFVSNVSHELRTPLAALIGEIDYALLKERTIQDYIKTLQNSKYDASRLIKLVNGLLDLAKASYEESRISMTEIRIDEVVLDARKDVLKADPQYKIDIQLAPLTEDDTALIIEGNEYLLKTAFSNLMENNCKFSENNTSTVKISSEQNAICISFSDTGIGILPEDMENIFKPFYRGKNKEFITGNGIGLALVDKVIKIHKGQIGINSAIGVVTTFYIRFHTRDHHVISE